MRRPFVGVQNGADGSESAVFTEVLTIDDGNRKYMITNEFLITAKDALTLAAAVGPGPVRELLTVVQRAIDATNGTRALAPPLVGPQAWAALAHAAGDANHLVELIGNAPGTADPELSPANGRVLGAGELSAEPPTLLSTLVWLLKAEVGAFRSRSHFESGLSLHPGALRMQPPHPSLGEHGWAAALPPAADRQTMSLPEVVTADPTLMGPNQEHILSFAGSHAHNNVTSVDLSLSSPSPQRLDPAALQCTGPPDSRDDPIRADLILGPNGRLKYPGVGGCGRTIGPLDLEREQIRALDHGGRSDEWHIFVSARGALIWLLAGAKIFAILLVLSMLNR